ncbi:MAG: TadE family protein [Planctomycetaceae bacterium]
MQSLSIRSKACGIGRRRPGPATRSGAAAVEMAIVAPVLIALLLGIIEIGLTSFIANNMWHAAREAARAYAVREVGSAGAIQLAQNNLPVTSIEYTITTSPENTTGREHWVEISAPYSAVSVGDPLNLFGDGMLTTRVSMRKEF